MCIFIAASICSSQKLPLPKLLPRKVLQKLPPRLFCGSLSPFSADILHIRLFVWKWMIFVWIFVTPGTIDKYLCWVFTVSIFASQKLPLLPWKTPKNYNYSLGRLSKNYHLNYFLACSNQFQQRSLILAVAIPSALTILSLRGCFSKMIAWNTLYSANNLIRCLWKNGWNNFLRIQERDLI